MTSKMYHEEVARLKLYVEILGFVTCANILWIRKIIYITNINHRTTGSHGS
jgi:predicted transcriptional regulator